MTAQNRKIIPLRWKHLILSLDPKGIVVLYLFTNILFFLRGVRLLTTWTNWLTVNLRACRFSTHSRFPPHRFLTPPKSFTFVVQHGDSSYRAWKMSSCKQINHPLAFFSFHQLAEPCSRERRRLCKICRYGHFRDCRQSYISNIRSFETAF